MNISKIISSEKEDELQKKVMYEYSLWKIYTKQWKEETLSKIEDYYNVQPKEEDTVKLRKINNNLLIRQSVFVSDEMQVVSIPSNGKLWAETAKNFNKVAKHNFKSMRVRSKFRDAITDDWLKGVWVLAVDWWNNHTQEPMLSYVDSLLTFPDPDNWQDNCMQFFWTLLRKRTDSLKADDSYDYSRIDLVSLKESQDIRELKREEQQIKDFRETEKTAGMIDIYNHLTIFQNKWDEGMCLYLTTWDCDVKDLLRIVKIRGLTDWELADPTTIDLWVKLFRAKPIKWSYAGESIIDEMGQYQDIQTLLTNLKILEAKFAASWPKTYLDANLWIDIDEVASTDAIGATIPYTSNGQLNAQNGIFVEPARPQNPVVFDAINMVDRLWDEASNLSSIASGQSLDGSQTKAEIQTLQRNINEVLSYMFSNYMESLEDLWTSIYRSYAANMSPQRKKEIVVVEKNGNTDSFWFKKKEFISNWEAYITIKSASQEKLRKEKLFSIALSVYGSLKQSVQPWSREDKIIDRTLIELSGLEINPLEIQPYTRDERIAYENLELLNNNRELKTKPQAWEDHSTYINVYRTWLETDARNKAIREREKAEELEPKQEQSPEQPQSGGVAQNLGASMLAQDNSQNAGEVSLAQVTW